VALNQGTIEQLSAAIESAGSSVSAVDLDHALSSVAPHPVDTPDRSVQELLDAAVFSSMRTPPTAEAGGVLGIVQVARDVSSAQDTIVLPRGPYLLKAEKTNAGTFEVVCVDPAQQEWRPGLRVDVREFTPALGQPDARQPYAVMSTAEVVFGYPSSQTTLHFAVGLTPDALLSPEEKLSNAELARQAAEDLKDRNVNPANIDVDANLRGVEGNATFLCAPTTEKADYPGWPRKGELLGVLAVLSGTIGGPEAGKDWQVEPGNYAVRADDPFRLKLEHAHDQRKDVFPTGTKVEQVVGRAALKCFCLFGCCAGRGC
jgi:hypothetical protein